MAYLGLGATSSLPVTINAGEYQVAKYNAFNPVNSGTYLDTGSIPIGEVTVLTQCTYFIAGGLTFTLASISGVLAMYIQIQRAKSTTWLSIAGQSVTCTTTESTTARNVTVMTTYRLFEGDKIRFLYFASTAVTIPYGNTVTNGRHQPWAVINTNIP